MTSMNTTFSRPLRVVGVGGSFAPHSASAAALDAALEIVRLAGEEVERFSIAELDLPMYRPGAEAGPTVQRFVDAVRKSDALIWSTPLYHGAISGAFKNAIDWLQLLSDDDRPYLSERPVGLIAVAGGTHALQAVNCMEYMVRALRGWAVPLVVPITEAHRSFSDGKLTNARVEYQLGTLALEVLRAAQRFGSDLSTPALVRAS